MELLEGLLVSQDLQHSTVVLPLLRVRTLTSLALLLARLPLLIRPINSLKTIQTSSGIKPIKVLVLVPTLSLPLLALPSVKNLLVMQPLRSIRLVLALSLLLLPLALLDLPSLTMVIFQQPV